jgi:thiamine-monophosphate kinase
MSEQRTEISSLGEFGLIEHLTKNAETSQFSTCLSVGDDAAVIDHTGQTVVTTDLLVEGIHFDLMYTPLKHLGYKSIIVNLSDVYAMNATPTQVTVSVALTNRMSLEAVEEFYEGIYIACKKYQVDLVGGDTTSSQKGFIISVTALGEIHPDKVVKRSTAKVGDLVCVSGTLGGAFLGLTLLEREKRIFLENPKIQPDLEQEDHIVGRILKPEARRDMISFFEDTNIVPTSMIDISDGLSSELLHICKQSRTGCKIYEDKLPIHEDSRKAAFKFGLDPSICALNGGEDYELLFTIKQDDYEKILLSEEISVIGYITEQSEGSKFISKSGQSHTLEAQGWNSFQ